MDVFFYILCQIILGWFTIDLITGIYHYIIDHRKETDFVIGGQVKDFMEHHKNPHSMEKSGFIARIWLTSFMSLPALFLAYLFWPVFWLTIFFGGVICQQAHYWSHIFKKPKIVQKLQQIGLIISPEKHFRHHNNFERSYGILNGWSHGTLDFIISGFRYAK